MDNGGFRPQQIVVHCAASPDGKPYPIERLRADHLARGFSDIGYHYVIQPNGDTEVGRSETEPGAHVKGHNHYTLGVCLVGTRRFTTAQISSLGTILRALLDRHGLGPDALRCHYEFDTARLQGKSCPSIKVENLRLWFASGDLRFLAEVLLAPSAEDAPAPLP